MDSLIFHVDLNSFFASVEQQNNPKLRGKPIGILKSLGRSCVIAASNEAKTFGIKTGMSLSEVKTLCPQIILVPAHFPEYASITKQFIKVMHQFSDVVEVFSLDEVFLDVTYTAKFFGGPLQLVQKIQDRVRSDLGEYLGVSIGIAKNKFLAKLASSLAPKKGHFIINDVNQNQVLKTAQFKDICGIGHRLSYRLKNMGITSLAQLVDLPLAILQAEFGPFLSRQLKCFSQGGDAGNLITKSALVKSVSRTFTLYADTRDLQLIKATIRNLIEEVCVKLRHSGLVGRQFGLSIRGDNCHISKYVTRKTFTDSGLEVFRELYTIYNDWHWPHSVRFIGVWVSLLAVKESLPLPLFENDIKQAKILQVMDSINHVFGEYTVYPAVMLKQNIISPEVNGYMKL